MLSGTESIPVHCLTGLESFPGTYILTGPKGPTPYKPFSDSFRQSGWASTRTLPIESDGAEAAHTRPFPSPVRYQLGEYWHHAAQYRDTVAFEIPKCAIV